MKNWIIICLLTAVLSALSIFPSHAEERQAEDDLELVRAVIPPSAHFDQQDLREDREVFVGRLTLHRRFLGTRAEPAYEDSVRFHCFDGSELRLLTFVDDDLKQQLRDRLAAGRPLPAVVTVCFERVRVGHDGINVGERLVPRVEQCQLTTDDAVCAAAQAADFDESDCARFVDALEPDYFLDGIAISLGQVLVRPQVPPRWPTSSVTINGIQVFNTTPDDVTIEIVGLEIEQNGTRQPCALNEQRSLRHWQVAAESWADGVYESGIMPQNRWYFDPAEPIVADQAVTVYLEIKINGKDKATLERIVVPMSLRQ